MILNLSNSDKTFWLVKFPPFLADKINSSTNEFHIGDITITSTGETIFTLSQSLASKGFPTEYTINTVTKSEKIYLLNDDVLEGYSLKEIFINPVQDEDYFNFIANRSKTIYKEPEIKIINYKNEGKTTKGFGSLSDVEFIARNRKKLLQAKKRERLDKTEVIDMIFRAFEKHKQWSVRDLADFTGQPLAYIQELLPDICNVNKKDHKGLYELKPEFRIDKE
ncbi:transcription initiation factor TFIIF subunit beta [Tubulinosema ratisbonensis]|uniref:Transcription initiation factor IIF subunit beta n=1 Tax=Tubulinosema ratisbonensis TaxID=291195 RepID=A0A437AK43_9MICR|nr:transcription initiation factor TFIIF subunit beta [Tubulinosema ratisbonensis]